MANYHLSIKIINRSSGRSSVGSSAYRAGEKLYNAHDGLTHDYTKKRGISYVEIMLPETAPNNFIDREMLWNAVEFSEKRKDAQTAREIELALPIELSLKQQIELVREYVSDNFTSKGMCADLAIHDKGDGNPHAHIMLTMREVTAIGFGQKNRDWNSKENAELWRKNWTDIQNKALEGIGDSERVDHRSFERRGIEQLPTQHLGKTATQLERRGIASDRGNENRKIVYLNDHIRKIKAEQLKAEQERDRLRAVYGSGSVQEQMTVQPQVRKITQEEFADTLAREKHAYTELLYRKFEAAGDHAASEQPRIKERLADLQKAKQTVAALYERIKTLEHRRAGLGFFKGRQKKELQQTIDELKSQITIHFRSNGLDPGNMPGFDTAIDLHKQALAQAAETDRIRLEQREKNKELLAVHENRYRKLVDQLNAQPEQIRKSIKAQAEKIGQTLKSLHEPKKTMNSMFAEINAKREAINILNAGNEPRQANQAIGQER